MPITLLPDNPKIGWTPYAWLVYLAFYALLPFLTQPPAWVWVAEGVGLVVFLILYFRAYWLEGRPLLVVACAIFGLGILLMPLNPGASCFCVYGASFLGNTARPATAFRWLTVLCALVAVETFVAGLRIEAWVPALLFTPLIGATKIHFAEIGRADVKLRLAHEEVVRVAKIAERERIGRDLHDLLGHTLSVIVLKSELASKLAERDPSRAAVEIREVERISRDALDEVRRAVRGYGAKSLDEEIATARAVLASAGVVLHADVSHVDLAPLEEGALSLALREAVTNVIRHARARNCWITLAADGGRVRLDVRDDGVGGARGTGAGLDGMRARVRDLAGTFEHDGRDGTRIRVSLPSRSLPATGAAEARA